MLGDWKCFRGKHTLALSKDVSLHLQKRLHSNFFTSKENHNDNLISGLQKYGIFPFVSSTVLKRLLDFDEQLLSNGNASGEDVSNKISQGAIDILKKRFERSE